MIEKIAFIRHGRTVANEKQLYCGSCDSVLSESGIQELHKRRQSGAYPCVEAFYTSGLCRTKQTLEIIYPKYQKAKAITELNEYHFGSFEECSHQDLMGYKEYQEWINDLTGEIACPNGETRNSFKKRVLDGYQLLLTDLSQKQLKSAAVVCHGGVIVAIMSTLIKSERHYYEWQPDSGQGYILYYKDHIIVGYTQI